MDRWYENPQRKNQAGGYAGVNADRKIPGLILPDFDFPYTIDLRLISTNAQVGNSNRAHFMRVFGHGTIAKLGINVVESSGNICIAVFGNEGTGREALPGARLATTGETACPEAGYAEVELEDGPVAVESGMWFGFTADNTTATFTATGGGVGELSKGLMAYQDEAFPLPASAEPTAGAASRVFAIVGV